MDEKLLIKGKMLLLLQEYNEGKLKDVDEYHLKLSEYINNLDETGKKKRQRVTDISINR